VSVADNQQSNVGGAEANGQTGKEAYGFPGMEPDGETGPRPYGQWTLDIWLSALLYVAYAHTRRVAPRLPDRIPVHFDFSGQPDGWGPVGFWGLYGVLIIAALVAVGTSVAIWFMARARDPRRLINLPPKQKERLTPAAAERVRVVLMRSLGLMKLVTVLMLVHMHWLSLEVALGEREGLGFVPLGYTIVVIFLSLYMLAATFLALGNS